MNGDQVIAKILKAEGVEWVGAFPAQPLIDEAAREGIRPILSRTERTGVNMADGFSRVRNGRNIGFLSCKQDPGRRTPSEGWRRPMLIPFPSCCFPVDNREIAPKYILILRRFGITGE